jgi:IS6 family transposase
VCTAPLRWRITYSGRLGGCGVARFGHDCPVPASRGSGFPPDVIAVAVRWYLRYSLSYRDVEELLAERGIEVDHVTVYRWVQRFTPLLIDAARPCRHAPGDRWFVDETHVKVAGSWVYLYRAIDQYGQVIDVLVSERGDLAATRRFFTRALRHGPRPAEVSTDRAPAYPRVLDELVPSACHVVEQYANNPIEADHGWFKARLRPMRGLKWLRSVRVISAGHAFVPSLRRGHYELGVDADPTRLSRQSSPNSPSPSDHGIHCASSAASGAAGHPSTQSLSPFSWGQRSTWPGNSLSAILITRSSSSY